jgi:DNA polymerase-3 subunit alpha
VLESLILAGAFDSLGYRRRALHENYAGVMTPILSDRRAEAVNQGSLFAPGAEPALDVDEVTILADVEFHKPLFLKHEKEMLGQFVTDHPLLGLEEALAAQVTHEIGDLELLGDGDLVTIGGIIGGVFRRFSKRGEPYAQFRLEGLAGGAEVVAFPSVYEADPDLIATDRIVLVTGRIDLRGRELQIRASEVREADVGASTPHPEPPEALVVDLPTAACTEAVLSRLKELLEANPGSVPVKVRVHASHGVTPLEVGSFRVGPSPTLLAELRALLGGASARIDPQPAAV